MPLIKFVLGTVVALVSIIVAIKLLALVLFAVGLLVKLVWLAVVLGFFVLVGWVIYKIVSPGHAEQS